MIKGHATRLVVLVMLLLASGLLPGMPAYADSGTGRPKAHGGERVVKGHRLAVRPRRTQPSGRPVPKAVWPRPGAAEVTVPAAGAARAGHLPVWARPPAGRNARPATAVKVRVLDRASAQRAGVDGPLLRVGADAATAGRVGISLDYSGFAAAYGGDYGSRLRFVRLPSCALTDPSRPQCRTVTPLATRNDAENRTLSADVDAAAPDTVLAATTSTSGPKGDYGATSLSASATWQAGGQSGDFSWSYPMRVPPTPGGLEPDVSISYSSQGVDGRTSNTNNQPSWVGEGFDLSPGFIERRYKSCDDDGAPADEFGDKPADECWAFDNATVTWNGHGGELIKASDGTWRMTDDDGTRFEKLTGATNGDTDGEYWKVTTTDGTQYYFGLNRLPGWTDGKSETDSAWTVPVFGNDSGEPCHGSTFADSWCQQAWRWNLDYAVDTHGNAISYWYTQESNHYGRDLKASDETPYVRGGYLDHIEYGQRADTLFSASAPAKVVFDTSERCIRAAASDCDPGNISTNPDYWPDVPWDLHCDSGQDCTGNHGSLSPSFWSRKRLTGVTTQVMKADGSGYRDVDSWALTHLWGDADVDQALLLDSITHTGAAGATPIALPEVSFTYVQRPNRLDQLGDDIGPYIKYRLGTVFDESGGQIDVNYSDVECSLSALPSPESNTRRCFPVYWTPPDGSTDPKLDWFNKYVVTKVIQTDRTGHAPDMITTYDYLGGGAWHYDDDDGLTKQKYKTWSQWRGYRTVRVQTGGTEGMESQTDHLYFQGMDGDRASTSGGTKSVSISDGEGGTHTDDDALAGFELKTTHYDGPGGVVVDKTVTTPWHHQTASRVRSWGTTTANLTGEATEHAWTALAAVGWRETETDTTHEDTTGLVTQVDDKGDTSTGSDDRCTRMSYAQNTSKHMLDLISREETVAVDCGTTPDRSKQVISDERTYYDNGAFGAAPVTGDATKTEKIADHDGTTATYVTDETKTYDAYGRVKTSADAAGNTTTTAYTDTSGLTTKTVETGPPITPGDPSTSLVTTTDLDPAWGVPLDEIDPNSKRTDLEYDALGRLTKVWLANTRKGVGNPNLEYSYLIADGSPVAVGTRRLNAQSGQYPIEYQIYDGWLRPRQTQAPGPNGGRLITDTIYNSRGLVDRTYDTYWESGAPETSLFGVDTPGDVETQTRYDYDGMERQTAKRLLVGNGDTQEKWRTTTAYGGDRVSVTPPAGGVATTTISDARGQTTEVRQYKGGIPSGDYDAVTYAHTPAGKLAEVKDAAGNIWKHTYDLRGREVQTDDPDKGTSTSTYNDLDQLTSTTDARGQKLFFDYDPLGRKTAEREDSATGTVLSAWTYDTVRKGYLTSSTRYSGGQPYTTTVKAYDNLYNPIKETVTIPAGEGALAGSYPLGISYRLDGLVQGTGYPAAGGLLAESVTYTYDDLQRVTKATGSLSSYVTNTQYSNTGKPTQIEESTGGMHAWQTFGYEFGTQRLAESRVDRENIAGVDRDAKYAYDNAGDVTSISDVSRTGTDTQCFTYDYLQRLTEAWTQGTTSCATTPTAEVVGGVAPYWQSFSYDSAGDRTGEIDHGTGGGTDITRTYTYGAKLGDTDQTAPHALASVDQSGGVENRTDTYAYDATGNTTTRTLGNANQTLTWDAEGRLASVTEDGSTTSYLYDADGNRLISHDASGATLYLTAMGGGDMQIRLDAASGTTSATRYYTLGDSGAVVAERTSTGVSFLAADAQGTALLAIDASTQVLSQRWLTPFGQQRGTPVGAWPGDHGFVDGVSDATGLVHLGAREYAPETGRFISLDPVFAQDDPQSWNGYAYADDNPVTESDPSGECPPDRCGIGYPIGGTGTSKNNPTRYVRTGPVDPGNPYAGYYHNGHFEHGWWDRRSDGSYGGKGLADRRSKAIFKRDQAIQRWLTQKLAQQAAAARARETQHQPWWRRTFHAIGTGLSALNAVVSFCPLAQCQVIAVAAGLLSAAAFAASGDFKGAEGALAGTALNIALGGFGRIAKVGKGARLASRVLAKGARRYNTSFGRIDGAVGRLWGRGDILSRSAAAGVWYATTVTYQLIPQPRKGSSP